MTARRNDLLPTSLREATGPVFHYTSSIGLLGIIETKRLRASEASGLNDLAEIRHGWRMIAEWLRTQRASDEVDLLTEFAKHPVRARHEVFVLSGSTAGDDANQWRLYADGGTGYAIQLDPSFALAAISETPAHHDLNTGALPWTYFSDVANVSPWLHVLYTKAEAVTATKELVAAVKSESRSIGKTAKSQEERDFRYDALRDESYDALSAIAHLIKTPGFSGENEVRVVTTFYWAADHIRYRPGPYGIVGYISLTATPPGYSNSAVLRPGHSGAGNSLTASVPVKSVRLGPLLSVEHKNTVRAFLRKNDLRTTAVTRSTVSLR